MRLLAYLENTPNRKGLRLLLLSFGALLCALCLVTQKLDILEWVSLVPMATAVFDISRDQKLSKRAVYGYGFFFFFCFYIVNFHWILYMYPLDFIDGMTGLSAAFLVFLGCICLPALQALGAGVAFIIFVHSSKVRFIKNSIVLRSLVMASLWTVLEWSQTIGWVGVPWARLAIGQTGLLIGAQSASLFGSFFVSFLIVFVNYLVAGAILFADKRRTLSFVSAIVFVLNFSVGAWLYTRDTQKGDPISVAAVQGNISSADKWDLTKTGKILEVYEMLTVEAAENGADIVVWPESTLPYNITHNITLLQYISRVARENEITLLVGAFTYDGDDEYNTIVTVLRDGSLHQTKYYKRHLVPFGEYVPYRSFFELVLPVLTEIMILPYDLEEGKSANVIELEEADIGSLICFDSIYDEIARDSARSGAQIFAVSTNDSWFSDSAALKMHNAQAQLRAIENRRYTVRSANTGISSIITSNGKIVAELMGMREGYVSANVYANSQSTLYSYLGNAFIYVCIVWLIVCAFCGKIVLKISKALDNVRKM